MHDLADEASPGLRGADGVDPGGEVLAERQHLVSLASRMLGTEAEAEDAVQETYIRWYRLSQASGTRSRCPRRG